MSAPPVNDLAKLTAAKNHALAVRRRLFAALGSGELDLHGALALAEHDPVVAKTRVRRVLAELPRWSQARADATLAELSITDKRTLRGLLAEDRQREAVLARVYRPRKRTTVEVPHLGWPYWGAAR